MKNFLSITLSTVMLFAPQSVEDPWWAKKGAVPDSKSAVSIAKVILENVYGKEIIADQLPLTAKLKDEVWTIKGHLPETHMGGVAEIKISRRDCKVISIEHGM